jgi:hypothetical protein
MQGISLYLHDKGGKVRGNSKGKKFVVYFTHFWSIQQKIQYSLNGRIKSYFGSGIQNKSADPELHQ